MTGAIRFSAENHPPDADLAVRARRGATMTDSRSAGNDCSSTGPAPEDILKLPPFEYSPLPTSTTIRLINVLPLDPSVPDVIRCSFTSLDLAAANAPLGPCQHYVALSYTWGAPTSIIEEPVSTSSSLPETSDSLDDFDKLPFVFDAGECAGGIRLHSQDHAMRYYVETHPRLPREVAGGGVPESAPRRPIEADGRLVYVHENLHAFLLEFRRLRSGPGNWTLKGEGEGEREDKHGRYLSEAVSAPIWIDAICINQDDLAERSAQVQLMGKVYRNARHVFAWLGPRDDFTDDAMQGLRLIADHGPRLLARKKEMTLSSFAYMDLVHWFAIFAFFQRSWFRRAWVTQEVIFGRQRVVVLHGSHVLSWDYLYMIAEALLKSGLQSELMKLGRNLLASKPLSDTVRQYRKLAAFREDDEENGGWSTAISTVAQEGLVGWQDGVSFTISVQDHLFRFRSDGDRLYTIFPPLQRVLSLYRNREATDPRDKIFAFLNLASDTEELGLTPDYSASTQEVFRRVTETIIRKTRSLSMLSQIQEPCYTRIQQLPGWVPDFSARLPYALLDTGDDDVLFCASGSGTEAWFEIHSDGTLEVETVPVDVVVCKAPTGRDTDDMLLELLKVVLRSPHWYPARTVFRTTFPLAIALGSMKQQQGRAVDEDTGVIQEPAHANSTSTDKGGGLEEAEKPDDDAVSDSSLPIASNVGGPDDDEKADAKHSHPNDRSSQLRESYQITRIEALWRTLVADMLPLSSPGFAVEARKRMTYPAPESLGRGFSNWVTVCLLEMWHPVNRLEHEFGDNDEMYPLRKAAARRFLTSVSAWAAVHGWRHIPLTADTVNFSLPIPDLGELAELEEALGETEAFFPSAARLNALFNGKSQTSIETRGRNGDPQAAVDGEWRELALSQFTEEERAEITAFERRMRTVLAGRTLFSTRSGLLGVGPCSVFSDKECLYEVHVIKGAKVPYVLASYDDGSYRVIGEAYVHGIMDAKESGFGKEHLYKKIRLV